MRVRDAGSDGCVSDGGLLGRAAAGSTGSTGSVGSVGSSGGAETTYELPDGQTLQIGEEVRPNPNPNPNPNHNPIRHCRSGRRFEISV